MKTRILIDADEMNKLNPDTFELLSFKARATLKPGEYCKIGLRWDGYGNGEPSGERFWVVVTKVFEWHYLGIVANLMKWTKHHGYEHGYAIPFGIQHVLQLPYDHDGF